VLLTLVLAGLLFMISKLSICVSYTRVYPKVSGLSHNEINNNKTTNIRLEATQRVMAAKLTRLTYKRAIQLHLFAESCTICSSRSRRPVRKILDTPSYIKFIGFRLFVRDQWSLLCVPSTEYTKSCTSVCPHVSSPKLLTDFD
jgi:hypothetical protein